MSKVLVEIENLIQREGGEKYTDLPFDRGGPTRWGVTAKVARRHGYAGDMRDLPKDLAIDIYLADYWIDPKFDQVAERDESLAVALFDWGVNSWHRKPVMALQRALNILVPNNPAGNVDGAIGPATLRALDAFKTKRGSVGMGVLTEMVNAQRQVFLMEIAEKDRSQTAFSYGWARRVTELR